MTYRQLFEKLTPEQMEQDIVIFHEDNEIGEMVSHIDVTEEDYYWDLDEYMGTEEDLKNDDLNPDDFSKVSKGSISLHSKK